jgi:hypothetical protein
MCVCVCVCVYSQEEEHGSPTGIMLTCFTQMINYTNSETQLRGDKCQDCCLEMIMVRILLPFFFFCNLAYDPYSPFDPHHILINNARNAQPTL